MTITIVFAILIAVICLLIGSIMEYSFAPKATGIGFDKKYFFKGMGMLLGYTALNVLAFVLIRTWPIYGRYFAMIAVIGLLYVVYRASEDANEVLEALALIILTVLSSGIAVYGAWVSNGGFRPVLIAAYVVIGIVVLLAVIFLALQNAGKVSMTALGVVLLAALALGLVAVAATGVASYFVANAATSKQEEIIDSVEDNQPIEEPVAEPEQPEPEPEVVEAWYHFFNLDLQDDEDATNDFNFGPNPYDIETEVDKDEKWMDAEFRRRLRLDPNLLAADAAYNDSITGTRYMGIFYDSAKEDWSQAMNDAADEWINNQDEFVLAEETFEKWLDKAVRVEIWTPKQYKMKITDQMYQDPVTVRRDPINNEVIPDIIAMETGNNEGDLLVYVFLIKNKEFYVPYRIQCGFQPVNVVKTMKITPKEPTTPPDKPKDDPKKDPKKDPTKGTQGDPVGPNDDPGPGPDTNNPENPNVSKEDENPTPNPDPNKDWDELEDINKPKPVEPVTPDPVPNVDDNEDDLDKPQPTPDPSKEGDGDPIANNPDNPGEEWGGPAD